MRPFFQTLLEKLKYLVGIDQGAKLTREEVTKLIDALVEECELPEWSKIKPEVKERVILDAIKNEKEFFGLTVKFVRGALRKFWDMNGQRILESEARVEFKPLARTPEELARIDEIANEYLSRLKPELKEVPMLTHKQIEEEGQVRPKAEDQNSLNQQHLRWNKYIHDKKIEFGRLFGDPQSFKGNLLPGSPTFEEWLELNP